MQGETSTPMGVYPGAFPGQRFGYPAAMHNDVRALLARHRVGGAPRVPPALPPVPSGASLIRLVNATTSGAALVPGDVVAIGDPPTGAVVDFAWRMDPILTAVEPTSTHVTANAFAVLVDGLAYPIGLGLARAVVGGAAIARVNITDAGHHAADIAAVTGQRYFVSGASGPVRILWRESGTGIKWALVRFGGGSGLPAVTQDAHVLQLDTNLAPYWGPTRVTAS